MTQDSTPSKQYGNTSVPYLGDISQIYGKVVYVVDVSDASGQVVHSEKLSSPTATLNYTPTGGTYTVTGYYAYESGQLTSNKLSQTITLEDTATATYSQVSLESTKLVLQMTIPAGHTVTVSLNGASQDVKNSGQVSFDKLTANTKYTITFVETTTSGKVVTLTPFEFTTPAQTEPAAPAA